MNLQDFFENIDRAQQRVKQLPADFRPPKTSPQLSGAYPGRNATRGYLVGEDQQRLDELLELTTEYVKLNDGSVVQIQYRPMLNRDPLPGSVRITPADPRTIPDPAVSIRSLESAGMWQQNAIRKAMASGTLNKLQQTVQEADDAANAMAQAVTRRIMNQHPEWLERYGVETVMQVIDAVTAGEEDWEEIGSSDVSAFVNMVGDRLADYAGSREEMRDRRPFAESTLNEVTQGVEHSEWADNVKDAYYPAVVRIVKKRSEDGRHVKSQAVANGKLVGQYNMNTGVGTFTNPKKQGVTEAVDPGRRRILAGMLGLAAQSIVPRSVASALTQELSAASVADDALERAALSLLNAIRWRLKQFEDDDYEGDGYGDEVGKIAGKLGMSPDQFEELMELYEYGSDPDNAAKELLRHLENVDPRTIIVKDRDFDDYDDEDDVVNPSTISKVANQAQTAAAAANQAQTAAAAAASFRNLLQRMMSRYLITAPPREKYMGRIEPTSSALALPAPDKTAAEIMRDLQDLMDRPLTNDEKEVVRQEIRTAQNKGVSEGTADIQRKVFKKNGKPVGEVGMDLDASPGQGDWFIKHYASGTDLSGYDSYAEAVQELKHLVRQGVAEGSHTSEKQILTRIRQIMYDRKLSGTESNAGELNRLKQQLKDIRSQQGVSEGAKWRSHPDAYEVDDEGNKTPRSANSPKFGYDPLQRRADTAGDAKTARGRASALKTSLRMARGNKGISEMDSQGYRGHRGDEDPGKGPEKSVKPAKAKDVAKDAEKELAKAMDREHAKKDIREAGYNPLDDERREQQAMDRERAQFKRDELEAELGGEEQRYRDIMSGTWYILINGRPWQRQGQPVTFLGRAAARRAGQTIKNRDPQKTVTITRELPAAGSQDLAEIQERLSQQFAAEDVLGDVRQRLGDMIQAKAERRARQMQRRQPPQDVLGEPVRRIDLGDGRVLEIHGDPDDGFRIHMGKRSMPTRFATLGEAEMATRIYEGRLREAFTDQEYAQAMQDYLARGGEIIQEPTRMPRLSTRLRRAGSRHIGKGREARAGQLSGRGANVGGTGKPVVAVEQHSVADTLPEKKDPNLRRTARTSRIMQQLRARYPEAQTDLEALLLDFRSGQAQDRRDINRLDLELDTEELEIDQLQRQIDSLRNRRGVDEAKKDACYNKVKSRYKVWPSAYASGALVQCRKQGAKNWGKKSQVNEGWRETLAALAAAGIMALSGSGAAQAAATDTNPNKITATIQIDGQTQIFDLSSQGRDVKEASRWLEQFLDSRGIQGWTASVERGVRGSGNYQRMNIDSLGGAIR